MADIAASDVTYSIQNMKKVESYKVNRVSVAFGNGSLTYPSGGVPLTRAKLGCPNFVEDIKIIDAANANGFVYKVVQQSGVTNPKLRIYQGDNDNAADAALIELVAATATPAAATLILEVTGW